MLVLHLTVTRLGNIIHSNKEIVDSVLLGVTGGVTSTVDLATQINDYTGGVGTVPLSAVIRSIYLFVQILPATGTANVDWLIGKVPSQVVLPTPGSSGGSVNRKWVLHEEKGIPGNAADGAYPLTFKGVIKIPKARQRMAEGDKITIRLVGVDTHNICIKSIYKVYT